MSLDFLEAVRVPREIPQRLRGSMQTTARRFQMRVMVTTAPLCTLTWNNTEIKPICTLPCLHSTVYQQFFLQLFVLCQFKHFLPFILLKNTRFVLIWHTGLMFVSNRMHVIQFLCHWVCRCKLLIKTFLFFTSLLCLCYILGELFSDP